MVEVPEFAFGIVNVNAPTTKILNPHPRSCKDPLPKQCIIKILVIQILVSSKDLNVINTQ